VVEAAGGLSWQPVVTASTTTVEAAKGYFINTTSNACTITLPSVATAGDQIILVDYARTWGTNAITIDSNGLNFQSSDDTYIVDYDTAGQALNLVYSGATVGWTPSSDIVNALEPAAPVTQKAIFGYGTTGSNVSLTNLVNSSGAVASDTTGVGTARSLLAATGYGLDKAIFGYGTSGSYVSITNLVNNSGVVAEDTTGVGTVRIYISAASYGTDKGIFGFGTTGSVTAITNLVSNSGVVATDTAGVGTARSQTGATTYGGDKAIFAYGNTGSFTNLSNKVSSSGVVASDTSGVGTNRGQPAAAGYGSDGKAIIAFGDVAGAGVRTNISNLISNTGVVGSDVTGVGTARYGSAAARYGGDKAIFAYGSAGGAIKNLVSNVGVVASDTSGAGTAREGLAANGFSYAA
jgi:hypothetical protein